MGWPTVATRSVSCLERESTVKARLKREMVAVTGQPGLSGTMHLTSMDDEYLMERSFEHHPRAERRDEQVILEMDYRLTTDDGLPGRARLRSRRLDCTGDRQALFEASRRTR